MRSPGRWAAALAAVALTALAAAPAQATYPGDNGQIAFANYMTGQIEVVDADGSGHEQLTQLGRNASAGEPSWSADGASILFEKHKPVPGGERSQIWVMDADGGNAEKLAGHGKFRYFTPQFNPSGARIVFTRCQPGDGICAIWDMAADGSDEQALTPYIHDPTNEAVDFHPIYSPDGTTIVFDRFFSDGELTRLFTMDADGTDQAPLTRPRLEAFGADWSPDGTSIVFATNGPRIGSNIWSIEPDGSNPQELTPDPYPFNNFFPSFSPEGDQLVFVSDRRYDDFCCIDLFLMPAGGGPGQRIHGITPPGLISPAWGPAT